MKALLPLTASELARAEERLRHPAPGSRIEAAQRFGIDLTLLIEQLRLTPAERVRRMHDVCQIAEQVRGAARRTLPWTSSPRSKGWRMRMSIS